MSHVAHFTTPTSLNFFDRMWMSGIVALCIALAHPCMHSNLHERSIEEHAMALCPQQCTALCASRCQNTTASLQALSRDHAGPWQKARQPGQLHNDLAVMYPRGQGVTRCRACEELGSMGCWKIDAIGVRER